MNTTDIISGLGVTFILVAFALNTFKKLDSNSATYFMLNFIGGALAFWGSILLRSVPFATLEGTWTIVAIFGLWKTFQPKSSETAKA